MMINIAQNKAYKYVDTRKYLTENDENKVALIIIFFSILPDHYGTVGQKSSFLLYNKKWTFFFVNGVLDGLNKRAVL